MSMVYKTILSHLHSAFCSSFHTYHERIRLIPSPLSPSCGLEPHTTVHVFSCSSHPIPLSPDRDRPVCLSWSGISPFLWCSASSSPSFSPSGGQESRGQSSSCLPVFFFDPADKISKQYLYIEYSCKLYFACKHSFLSQISIFLAMFFDCAKISKLAQVFSIYFRYIFKTKMC